MEDTKYSVKTVSDPADLLSGLLIPGIRVPLTPGIRVPRRARLTT